MTHKTKAILAAALCLTVLPSCTAKNTEEGMSGLHLTDTPAVPGLAQNIHYDADRDLVCESPTGWYYVDCAAYSDVGVPVLCYADRETGVMTPLCSKPECTHNGSTLCTASTSNYKQILPVFAEGGLYSLARREDENGTDSRLVLLRYALDGTSIEEVARLTEKGDNGRIEVKPLYHRGYLWMIVARETGPTDAHGIHQCFGWDLVGYELATGKTVTVLQTYPEPDPAKDVDKSYGYTPPNHLFADGDCLYYGKYYPEHESSHTAGDKTKRGLWRLNLVTGENEFLTTKSILAVADGYGWYCDMLPENLNEIGLFRIALEPGAAPGSAGTLAENMVTDGQYLYAATGTWTSQNGRRNVLSVTDTDGRALVTLEGDQLPQHDSEPLVAVTETMVYYQVSHTPADDNGSGEPVRTVWCSPKDALLSGAPTWKAIYDSPRFSGV